MIGTEDRKLCRRHIIVIILEYRFFDELSLKLILLDRLVCGIFPQFITDVLGLSVFENKSRQGLDTRLGISQKENSFSVGKTEAQVAHSARFCGVIYLRLINIRPAKIGSEMVCVTDADQWSLTISRTAHEVRATILSATHNIRIPSLLLASYRHDDFVGTREQTKNICERAGSEDRA